jgi:hypothetical protein
MKRTFLCVAAMALAASTLGGCKSSTEKAEEKSVASARTFRHDLAQMPARVDGTMNTLYDVGATNTTNRADRYNAFRDQLNWLQQDAKRVAAEADKAKSDRETYFREWNREAVRADAAKREDMNATAAARRINYDNAVAYLENAKENYRQLVAQLNDINKMLGGDLTKFSSPDVQQGINNATVKSTNLKNYISRLTEQIDSALAGVPE